MIAEIGGISEMSLANGADKFVAGMPVTVMPIKVLLRIKLLLAFATLPRRDEDFWFTIVHNRCIKSKIY